MKGDTVADTPEALRQDIERTRAELGETIEALAAKADVKARAHEAADEVRERVQTAAHHAMDTVAYQVGRQRARIGRLDPRVRVGLVALAVGLVTLLIVRKARGRASE